MWMQRIYLGLWYHPTTHLLHMCTPCVCSTCTCGCLSASVIEAQHGASLLCAAIAMQRGALQSRRSNCIVSYVLF